MLKLIATIILGLSFIFLLKECIVSLRSGNLPAPPPAAEEKKQAKPQAAFQAEKGVSFYPAVPPALPDLNKGYLFNEERSLEGAADAAGADETEEGAADSPVVDMETVFYAGSIIIGETRKGLVTFPTPAIPARKTVRPQKGAAPAAAAPQKQRNYAQLVAGDSFSGYKVIAVEADRIVFQKGEETVEKLLNDPKKSRIAAPAPPPAAQQKQKTAPAETTKTNRVQLDKAKTATRPVQSARPGASAVRAVPGSRIQVPGVPAQAPAPAPVTEPVPSAPAPAPAQTQAPAPAPLPEELEPPEAEPTN
jgi:hypothetical protein